MSYARFAMRYVYLFAGLACLANPISAEEAILAAQTNSEARLLASTLQLNVVESSSAFQSSRLVVELPNSLTVEELREWIVFPGSPVLALEANQRLGADGRPQSFIDKLPSTHDFHTQASKQIIFGDQGEDATAGISPTIVAVIDSGIDPTHPLFQSSLIQDGFDYVDGDSSPFEEEDGLDNDGDGLIDESHGHGTSVASLVLLSNRSARLLPYRVVDADGFGSLNHLIDAVEDAVSRGAQVIQLSLSMEDPSPLLESALDLARVQGVIAVASAGNTGEREARYPAAYDSVIGVAATDHDDVLDPDSTRGSTVDLVAPGLSSIAAIPGGQFTWVDGSSMAAPLVAGAVSLLLSASEQPDVVEWALRQGAVDVTHLNPGDEDSLGGGRLLIPAAMDSL